MIRASKTVLLTVVFLVLFSRSAYAYVDPGSGAILWQVLAAGFFGVLFYGRKYWHRIVSWRNPKKDISPEPEDE